MQKSMRLEYEPSSRLLHTSASVTAVERRENPFKGFKILNLQAKALAVLYVLSYTHSSSSSSLLLSSLELSDTKVYEL